MLSQDAAEKLRHCRRQQNVFFAKTQFSLIVMAGRELTHRSCWQWIRDAVRPFPCPSASRRTERTSPPPTDRSPLESSTVLTCLQTRSIQFNKFRTNPCQSANQTRCDYNLIWWMVANWVERTSRKRQVISQWRRGPPLNECVKVHLERKCTRNRRRSRWVHRKCYSVFILGSNKDQRKLYFFFLFRSNINETRCLKVALERNTLFQKTDSVWDFIFAKTKVTVDKTLWAICWWTFSRLKYGDNFTVNLKVWIFFIIVNFAFFFYLPFLLIKSSYCGCHQTCTGWLGPTSGVLRFWIPLSVSSVVLLSLPSLPYLSIPSPEDSSLRLPVLLSAIHTLQKKIVL